MATLRSKLSSLFTPRSTQTANANPQQLTEPLCGITSAAANPGTDRTITIVDAHLPDERDQAAPQTPIRAMNTFKSFGSPDSPTQNRSTSGQRNATSNRHNGTSHSPQAPTSRMPSNGLTPTVAPSARSISSQFSESKAFMVSEEQDPSSNSPWSSAVGKSTLGKSGRVIEKLMAENDALKRELKSEKLRAEESRNATKMAEARMESLAADYEGRLHEAAIDKAQLKRRERQYLDLKDQLDAEKSRAEAAIESEKTWRAAMEDMEHETMIKLAAATNAKMLAEGRSNTLENHWKDQGRDIQSKIEKHRKQMSTIMHLRKTDAKQMLLLHQLCEQQAERLRGLENEKKAICDLYDAYRKEQDGILGSIKEKAVQQSEAGDRGIEEMTETLNSLKWALSLHNSRNSNT